MRPRLPLFIKIWFGLDLFLSLFPPIHWALNKAPPVAGYPATVAYVAAMSVFVAASLVAAYAADRGGAPRGLSR